MHADERRRTSACIRVHRRFQTTALVPFLFYQPCLRTKFYVMAGAGSEFSLQAAKRRSENGWAVWLPRYKMLLKEKGRARTSPVIWRARRKEARGRHRAKNRRRFRGVDDDHDHGGMRWRRAGSYERRPRRAARRAVRP